MIDGLDTNALIITFFIYGGVTIYGILRARGYPDSDQLTDWMDLHGLDPGATSRNPVRAYLNRTRWIRTIGFLVGWNAPLVWLLITRSAYRMNEAPGYLWIVGFALGILIAEMARPLPIGGASSIEPRRLDHYLPGFTRIDRWYLAGLALLPLAASNLLPVAGVVWPNETARARNDFSWYLTLALAAITIIVATRLVQGWIVHRRQSFEDVDEMRADDAMRSNSIQGLAGLGYGGPMLISSTMGWDLVLTTRGSLSVFIGVISGLVAFLGLGMLLGFPRMDTKWTVPRARTMA